MGSFLLFYGINVTNAQTPIPDFPFDDINGNAETFTATINVNSGEGTSPFKNELLGSNVDINTRFTTQQSRGPQPNTTTLGAPNQGFDSPILQNFLNEEENDPVVIRFPQGVFGNLYNWRDFTVNGETFPADSRSSRDPITRTNANGRRLSEFVALPSSGVRLGYPSLRGIFDRAMERGLPLDLLTVLNIIEDNGFSSRDRIRSMREDGYTVRDVELGNEFFFRTQRSNTIDTEEAWVERAQEVVRVLRRNNDSSTPMRFGIPISFRAQNENNRNAQHTRYNRVIVGDQSFFDAIVVHRYVSVGVQTDPSPTPAASLSDTQLRELYSASNTINESINFCQQQVQEDKRRVWLTEWGVSGGSELSIGASCLGMADTYLNLLKRDDMDRINWFSTFGLNAQYQFNSNTSSATTARGFGRIYQTIRDVARDNLTFDSVVVTAPRIQLNGANQSVRSINAIAFRADGNIKLLIANMVNKSASIVFRTNGNRRRNFSYTSTGVRFASLRDTGFNDISEDENNTDIIQLRPYSLTVVDLNFNNSSKNSASEEKLRDGTIAFSAFPNPSKNGKFRLSIPGNWEAFTLQGVKIKSGNGTNVDLSGLASGLYILKMGGNSLKLLVQ